MAIIFQLFSFSAAKPSAPRWVSAEAGDAQGLQIIARSSMNLGYSATDPSAPPVMLHAQGGMGWLWDGQVGWARNGQVLYEHKTKKLDTSGIYDGFWSGFSVFLAVFDDIGRDVKGCTYNHTHTYIYITWIC